MMAIALSIGQMGGQMLPESCDSVQSKALQQSAHDALVQRQYDLALQRFQMAFTACPGERSLLLELSQTQLSRRDFAQAIRAAQRYVEGDPRSVPGHLALANAYLMALKLPEAKLQAKQILEIEPENGSALKILGNAAYLSGTFIEAKDTFIQLLERHPEDTEAAYMLGRVYYQEGLILEAKGQFQRVLKLDPRFYKAWDNLGLCDQALGDNEKATRHFLTAIKLVEKDHPDYDWAYANLAELLLANGDAEQAFRAVSMAADRNPKSPRNFYLGGKALDKLGKDDLALSWLQRSAALDPNYPEPLYLLSLIYHRLGDEQKAADARNQFLAVKTRQPEKRR